MSMANLRSKCSWAMASRMKGNFCTVVMMSFFPSVMSCRRPAESSACPTVELTWANCRTVALIWLSSTRRSVTMMTESKTFWPSFWRAMNWRVSQAMELDFPLPAECWTR